MPGTKPKLSDRAQKWLGISASAIGVSAVVYSALLATITGWADSRYVLKGELAEAVTEIGESIEKAAKDNRESQLSGEIRDLQDDIAFFSTEQNMQASVIRRCRKLPRVIQQWQELTNESWERDPVVEAACRAPNGPPNL